MFGGKKPGFGRLIREAAAATVVVGTSTLAWAGEVHVPAQTLAQSLKDIAHQTGANILFAPEAVRGHQSGPVDGTMSAQEAVTRLIAGTGLQVVSDGSGGLIVRQAALVPAPMAGPVQPSVMPSENEIVIVTGIRGSLQRNLDLKRIAPGLVDVITNEDTGRFPASNLATALMRIPGVTVNRAVTSLNGINSSTGEPTEITVRGFGPTFNETLFDGRKIASGISTRAFDFSALNSDLVQEVDILKSPDPSLSAGAIGATLNIKYPKPFEMPGKHLAASASTTYTPEEGVFTPNGNFLFSDTFAGHRLGVLLGLAYSETRNRSNEVSVWGWEGTYLDPCQFAGSTTPCGADFTPDTSRPVWYIQDYGVYQIHNWQMRENAVAVVQWQPNNAVLLTVNGNFARNNLKERQYGYAVWNNASEMRSVTTSANGTITNFVRAHTPNDFDAQVNEQVLQNYDAGLNLKWTINQNLIIQMDADHALSSLNPGGQFGDFSINIGYGPSTPNGTNGSNIGIRVSADEDHVLPHYTSYGPNGDASRFLDPSLLGTHVVVLMSQRNRNLTNQVKLEANWEKGDLRLASGVQYVANHLKLSNWQNFVNGHWQAFAGYGPASNNYYSSGPGAGLPAGVSLPPEMFTRSFSTENFISGWRGAEALPPRILMFDPLAVFHYIQGLGDPGAVGTLPGFNYGCCDPAYRGDFGVTLDPANYQHIYEDNYAAYLRLIGLTDIAGMQLQYQASLRAEATWQTSTGIGRLPTALAIMPADHTAYQISYAPPTMVRKSQSYHYFLPTADLNLQITPDLHVRLDVSRTLTRPPLSYLSPVLNLTSSERVGSLVASSGNPTLQPFLADNLDTSVEWYYAPNSYVSANAFLKNVTNFIVAGITDKTINDVIDPVTGKTAIFRVAAPFNGPKASVYGVELAMQHVFGDTGFGLQANGTMVSSNKPYNPYDLNTSGFAVTGLADSANLIAFYDKDGFQIRIAANWRDTYLDHFGQQQNYSAFGAEPTFVNASWNFDLSASLTISDSVDAYCEIMNLFDTSYSTRGRFSEQVLDVVDYGRRITLGLHYRL